MIRTSAKGFLVLSYGADKAKEMAEEWETPSWIYRRALSDKAISKARSDLKKQMKDKINEEASTLISQLDSHIKTIVEREIDALSEINQL